MAQNFLGLVNRLRDRFNEPRLTDSNWSSVVGFDQYTKDAINYAIRDICNAESEWPFVAIIDSTIDLLPGIRTYTATATSGTGQTSNIRKIDWESFYLNQTAETENTPFGATIPATAPYTVDVEDDEWNGIGSAATGVLFFPSLIALTPVDGDPGNDEYTVISDGVYLFNSADAGLDILINYRTYNAPDTQTNTFRTYLPYIDLDYWRQNRMNRDFQLPGALDIPLYVYKQQTPNGIGISPIPDKPYQVSFDCWVTPSELENTTDAHIIPETFEDVILDGASFYCHGFREDAPMAKDYKDKFMAGIGRMRVELINRDTTMRSAMQWKSSHTTNSSSI